MKNIIASVAAGLCALFSSVGNAQSMNWVTGYYPTWWYDLYNPGITWDGVTVDGKIRTPDVDYTKMTHIVIFGAACSYTSPYLNVMVGNPSATSDSANVEYGWQTGKPAAYLKTIIANAHAVGTKVVISIGGVYGSGAANMLWIAQDSARTATYVQACVGYAKRKGLDGVEIDWEFPYASSRYYWNRLIMAFRYALDQWTPKGLFLCASYARTDEKIVGGVYQTGSSFAYTRDTMLLAFDQINCMTYTMWQGNDQDYRSGFNTPINTPSQVEFSGYNGYSLTDADTVTGKGKGSVQTWIAAGYPADRLGLSISVETSVFSGVSTMGQKYGSFNFGDFRNVPDTNRYWNATAQAPWYSDGASKVISFEDTVSCRLKVEWARSKGLGGIMVYQLGSGFLTNGPLPKDQLLQSIAKAAGIGATGVIKQDPNQQGPRTFELYQNYPNPFNPGTIIPYSLKRRAFVTLEVVNTLGQIVATLVNEVKDPGLYHVEFDTSKISGGNGTGSRLASGVYFYRLTVGNMVATKKLLLLK